MPKGKQGFQKGHKINVGRVSSAETVERMRQSKLGDKNPMFNKDAWNKGKSHMKNSDNPAWKGGNVGYYGLHLWIRRHLPKPTTCKNCNEDKKLEVSNSGVYDRDFNNWEWLCRSCHAKKDKRYLNCKMKEKKHSSETKQKMRDAWKRRKMNPSQVYGKEE